jgi:beta-glucosidase
MATYRPLRLLLKEKNMKKFYLLGIGVGLLVSGLTFGQTDVAWDTPTTQTRDAFIDQLMQRMTIQEKIGQLRLLSVNAGPDASREPLKSEIQAGNVGAIFNTVTRPRVRELQQEAVEHSRLKIPLFFAYDVVHGHRTAFPISLGLASTYDMDAIALSGRIAAQEASADGLNMTFAPMADLARDPRWGRSSEGFGEDTYLTSRIVGTLVRAFQGNSLSAPNTIMAVVKHFALYGASEGGKDYNSVDMSLQRMYQDYLPPYKAAVDAGAGGVMVALNSINGVPATANKWLLRDVLRDQWGFEGLTVSDHGAIMELIQHGVAADSRQAARLALKAGVNLSMNDRYYGQYLESLLSTGEITQEELNEACRRVLTAKYNLGLFKNPYRLIEPTAADAADPNAESRLHRAAAREVARRSFVLLKNDKQTLPLKKQGVIAVVGPLAQSKIDVIGSWSAAALPRQAVSVYEGLAKATQGKAQLLYAKGANITDDRNIQAYLNSYNAEIEVDPRPASQMIDEAVRAAEQADVVLALVGEARGMSHESSSRTHLDIPACQQTLLKALKATGKPLVLVLMNGRPLTLTWEHHNADAILETWFGGTETGNAVADVLFGDYNPSGKLPMSFPRTVGQLPVYYSQLNTGRPPDPEHPGMYTSRYFDVEAGPLYPFGYGLSYTRFQLSDIRLSSSTLPRQGQITASVTVTNTGQRDGETVVQLYTRDLVASISRPVKELKNFHKLMLKAGQSKTVKFVIRAEDLKFYNNDLQHVAEPGDFKLYIGLDSREVKEQRFTLL